MKGISSFVGAQGVSDIIGSALGSAPVYDPADYVHAIGAKVCVVQPGFEAVRDGIVKSWLSNGYTVAVKSESPSVEPPIWRIACGWDSERYTFNLMHPYEQQDYTELVVCEKHHVFSSEAEAHAVLGKMLADESARLAVLASDAADAADEMYAAECIAFISSLEMTEESGFATIHWPGGVQTRLDAARMPYPLRRQLSRCVAKAKS